MDSGFPTNGQSLVIGWVVPPPSKSHHQDYYIFSRGSRTKPSFATIASWEGGQPKLLDFLGPPSFLFETLETDKVLTALIALGSVAQAKVSWGSMIG